VDCYAAVYKDEPIGLIVVTPGIGKIRYFRISRIVTIPDYQGIGVAKALMGFVGEKYHREGKLPLTMVTSNPQFIHAKLPNWIITRIGHQGDHSGSLDRKEIRNLSKTSSKRRITISMRYVPPRSLAEFGGKWRKSEK